MDSKEFLMFLIETFEPKAIDRVEVLNHKEQSFINEKDLVYCDLLDKKAFAYDQLEQTIFKYAICKWQHNEYGALHGVFFIKGKYHLCKLYLNFEFPYNNYFCYSGEAEPYMETITFTKYRLKNQL